MGLELQQENEMRVDEELEGGGARAQRDGHLLEGVEILPLSSQEARREGVQYGKKWREFLFKVFLEFL